MRKSYPMSTTSSLSFLVCSCLTTPSIITSCCIISNLEDQPNWLLSVVLTMNSFQEDDTKTKKNSLFFRTVCITGDLQLGLLITSIILFTLLLLMGKNRLILLWSCFCYVKLEIFPFMLHLVTSGEMGPKLVRSHTQQRILSHGCFSLYLAQTIPMRYVFWNKMLIF